MTQRYPRSRGLVELERLGHTHASLAKTLGKKRTAITMIMTRTRTPTKALRTVMQKKLKIDPSWWDEEPSSEPVLDEKTIPLTSADAVVRARKLAMRLLAEAENETLPPAERAKRLKIALEAMKDVDAMTGEAGKISMTKILVHPAWKQIEDTIIAIFGREQLEKLRAALRPFEDVEA